MLTRRKWLKWIGGVVALLAILGGIAFDQAQSLAKRQLAPYLSRQLSGALGRPVTVGTVGFRLPATFTLRQLYVAPKEGEKEPPLAANKLRVGISWWDLLIHRRLKVTGLDLIEARAHLGADLRAGTETQVDATRILGSLYATGLRRIRLRDSSVEVATRLPDGTEQPVKANGVFLDARLHPASYAYTLRAANWSGAGLEAGDLHFRGTGDSQALRITESRARFQGGELVATGAYVGQGGDIAMQVRVYNLPLGNLAPQLGIPKEWNVRGSLTGTVDLSAASGVLRSAVGTLDVAPGAIRHSDAEFPWSRATAKVDWRPDRALLREIDVQGEGIRLQGNADINGPASLPLAERRYQATGQIEASRSEAVTNLGRLLAVGAPAARKWDVGRATVTFKANGQVGKLQASRAAGHLRAEGLKLRLTQNELVIRTVDADIQREAGVLRVSNIKGEADGLTVTAAATIRAEGPRSPERLTTRGQIELTSLAVLKQQLPDAPFWQWVRPALPASLGRVTFTAEGPAATPEHLSGAAHFRLREFAGVIPASGQGAEWEFPVRELSGTASIQQGRLTVPELKLRSDLFAGSGNLVVPSVAKLESATGAVRLTSARWQQLPPLKGKVPAGLEGGTLTVEARLPESQAAAAQRPLDGMLALRGATYRATVGGKARVVRLQDSAAQFRMAGKRLTVSSYRLVTPQFRTTGSASAENQASGTARPDWKWHATGTLSSADAGSLAQWWTGQNQLRGGALTTRYTADGLTSQPNDVAVRADVRLTNATPVLPAGTLPFRAEETQIRSLTGTFAMKNGVVRFSDAIWQAPHFRAKGNGLFDGKNVDGHFVLATSQWQTVAGELARTLPVTGGVLEVTGDLKGPVTQLSAIPTRGKVTLRGARLASDRNASVPLQGGSLDLAVQANGPLNKLVSGDLEGNFAVRDLPLPRLRPNAAPLRVEVARGQFHRTGTRVRLTHLLAQVPGGRLSGEGELRGVGTGSAAHSFSFSASGAELAKILPSVAPLPGKPAGGKFNATLTLSGTAAQPVAQMEARAEVTAASWTPPGQTAALPINRMAAHLVRKGSSATLDNVELKIPGGEATVSGSMEGLGTPAGERHQFRAVWKLEDASGWAARFLPIPGGFTGGVFTGQVRVSGTASQPARFSKGAFEVRDAGFMPPAKFLGGPERPIQVRSAGSSFHRANGKTVLDNLKIDTSVGMATGKVTANDNGIADLQAKVQISKLESLVDLWPAFDGRLRGGRGEMTLALRGPLRKPRALAGTVTISGWDGVLTVENVDDLYARQPFEEASVRLLLASDGSVKMEKIRLRGPQANLDGSGTVTADGRVRIEGDSWFTSRYTKKLFKPKILYPLASAVGLGRIKSDYKLSGTLREARLNMGITRTKLWKLAIKKKVPEPLRRIATGEAPLWSGDGPGTTRTVSTQR